MRQSDRPDHADSSKNTLVCYAEFAAMALPGQCVYLRLRHAGRIICLDHRLGLVLEYSVAAATVAIRWSQYLNRFLGSRRSDRTRCYVRSLAFSRASFPRLLAELCQA